jgi:hypothetical protein
MFVLQKNAMFKNFILGRYIWSTCINDHKCEGFKSQKTQ